MQSCIRLSTCNCRAQNLLTIAISPQLPVKIGEIDRRRHKLRSEPQRSLVLGFRFSSEATACIEISERRARLRPIGVETLGSDELGRGAFESLAIGWRKAFGRNPSQQRSSLDAHAAIRI